MYLVTFLNQQNSKFITTLHSTRAEAEAAFETLLRRFILTEGGPLPPKAEWNSCSLGDRYGEGVHLFKVECDGGPAEEIWVVPDQEAA